VAHLISNKLQNKYEVNSIKEHLSSFYATDQGIGFYFGAGRLDCYACGPQEVFIRTSELLENDDNK